MKATLTLATALLGFVVTNAFAAAPQSAEINPTTAKTLAEYQAQLEANKKIVAAFWAPGVTADQRYDLLHVDYIQHNPAFKKFADENGLSYKEGFKPMLAQLQAGGGGPPGGGANPDAPRPPPGNNTYMLLAENDLVFVMRQQWRQEPTKAPGTFYATYAWDTFRIKDGKIFEHWDGALINPPPSAAPGAPR